MGTMSNFSARRVRNAALLAAPLTVLALSLSACSPKHVTSLDSPTPKASDTAAPAAQDEKQEAPQESSAPETDDAVDLSEYKVESLTVEGNEVDTRDFIGVSVSGDASDEDGAQLTTIGLCSGAVYTVTGTDEYSSDAEGSANEDKCADPADAKVAEQLDKVLGGTIEVEESGDDVTITGESGELALTADN